MKLMHYLEIVENCVYIAVFLLQTVLKTKQIFWA